MNIFRSCLIVCLLFLTATANAQNSVGDLNAGMERTAGDLVRQSLTLMEKSEIDKAVGFATAALDIAREIKDADMVMRIEKLLAAMRAVNVVLTAVDLEERGRSVPALRTLGCRMVKDAPTELRSMTQRYTKGSCEGV